MKDKEVKLEDTEDSHELGGFVVYYEVIKWELNKRLILSVGVMKDYKINLRMRDLHVSHTLGDADPDWNT
jgi:hypothetical protein